MNWTQTCVPCAIFTFETKPAATEAGLMGLSRQTAKVACLTAVDYLPNRYISDIHRET
jgi:hypothetical protein